VLAVEPGTIVVSSDLSCPWARLAVHRLHETRKQLGLEGRVVLDHRAFPLEVEDGRPTPKRLVDAEIAVVGAIEPGAGWQLWQPPDFTYPVSTLVALEAVQATKEQGLRASEQLDRALRSAFFQSSRCISLRQVILEVAAECDGLDEEALRAALDGGNARRLVFEQYQAAKQGGYTGSPHIFLADGTHVFNPGIKAHWVGSRETGFPAVHADDPSIYANLIRRAAGAVEAAQESTDKVMEASMESFPASDAPAGSTVGVG
jgi:predicted DsbA family dithiol-disulfide isomerase